MLNPISNNRNAFASFITDTFLRGKDAKKNREGFIGSPDGFVHRFKDLRIASDAHRVRQLFLFTRTSHQESQWFLYAAQLALLMTPSPTVITLYQAPFEAAGKIPVMKMTIADRCEQIMLALNIVQSDVKLLHLILKLQGQSSGRKIVDDSLRHDLRFIKVGRGVVSLQNDSIPVNPVYHKSGKRDALRRAIRELLKEQPDGVHVGRINSLLWDRFFSQYRDLASQISSILTHENKDEFERISGKPGYYRLKNGQK